MWIIPGRGADAFLAISVPRAPRGLPASLPSQLRLGAGRGRTRASVIDACVAASAPNGGCSGDRARQRSDSNSIRRPRRGPRDFQLDSWGARSTWLDEQSTCAAGRWWQLLFSSGKCPPLLTPKGVHVDNPRARSRCIPGDFGPTGTPWAACIAAKPAAARGRPWADTSICHRCVCGGICAERGLLRRQSETTF